MGNFITFRKYILGKKLTVHLEKNKNHDSGVSHLDCGLKLRHPVKHLSTS